MWIRDIANRFFALKLLETSGFTHFSFATMYFLFPLTMFYIKRCFDGLKIIFVVLFASIDKVDERAKKAYLCNQ